MSYIDNYQMIKEKIEQSCKKSYRDTNEVKIIAVTKYVDFDTTKQVINLGLQHIGENRVPQAVSKYEGLNGEGTWHFIGNLQTRKVKQIIGKYDYIHSLDRLSLAEEINKRAKKLNIRVKCFVQVNISEEESKSGIEPEQLFDFIKDVVKFDFVHIVGLMTMAPFVEDEEITRSVFRKLKELQNMINKKGLLGYPINELSMGMSNDFEVAIAEGATFVRLGSILFK